MLPGMLWGFSTSRVTAWEFAWDFEVRLGQVQVVGGQVGNHWVGYSGLLGVSPLQPGTQ